MKQWHHHWGSASHTWSGRPRLQGIGGGEKKNEAFFQGQDKLKLKPSPSGGWWKRRGEESRGHAGYTKRDSSLRPGGGPPYVFYGLWYLDGFSWTSGIVHLSKSIDARSVHFMLLSDPECSLNKGQWLERFNSCGQSSSSFYHLLAGLLALVIGSNCDSDIGWDGGAKPRVFIAIKKRKRCWWCFGFKK